MVMVPHFRLIKKKVYQNDREYFLVNLRMHSSTQISYAGLIFDAEYQVRLRDYDFLLFHGIKSESNQ